ncbi:MAG: hypothetical protein K6T57_14095 [Thermaceae bacterium]|nr:hypothetical protein [Thermaceae bacterium]
MTDWWEQTVARIRPHLEGLRVALYASGGAPSHHLALLALWGGWPRVIHAEEIVAGGLEGLDAVIFPGGGLLAMAGQLNPLQTEGVAQIRRWVHSGGTYIGTCAGSCHPLRMSDPYRIAFPTAASFQMCEVAPLNAAGGAWGLDSPGTGRIWVQAEDLPLFEGLAGPFEIVHYNGPLFPPAPGAAGKVLKGSQSFTPFEASLGVGGARTLERCIAQGARIAYHQAVGAGQVILFGAHPEFGASALQLGWLPASRLLANALKQVQPRGKADPSIGEVSPAALSEARHVLTELRETLERLTPLGDLLPPNTPPFLGYSGPALWRAVLEESGQVLERMRAWLGECPIGEGFVAPFLLDSEPRPNQDFGFMGARQLLARALQMARQAEATRPEEWPAFSGAYNEFLHHPYHLVASTYLSAGGLIAGAALQATAFASANRLSLPRVVPLTATGANYAE